MCHLGIRNSVVPGNPSGRRRGNTMSELSIHELEIQHTELLPEREALGIYGSFDHNHVDIHSYNFSQTNVQVQHNTFLSHQTAVNTQFVINN
jgi:hypothetical protein